MEPPEGSHDRRVASDNLVKTILTLQALGVPAMAFLLAADGPADPLLALGGWVLLVILGVVYAGLRPKPLAVALLVLGWSMASGFMALAAKPLLRPAAEWASAFHRWRREEGYRETRALLLRRARVLLAQPHVVTKVRDDALVLADGSIVELAYVPRRYSTQQEIETFGERELLGKPVVVCVLDPDVPPDVRYEPLRRGWGPFERHIKARFATGRTLGRLSGLVVSDGELVNERFVDERRAAEMRQAFLESCGDLADRLGLVSP